MSLREQQNLLAKLYTDAGFRKNFLEEPLRIGTDNGLSVIETQEIAAIMPEELEFFADSLFWKRLREVEKILALTKRILGSDFTNHFRDFSENFNPKSVKKHFEDAFEFSGFLIRQNIPDLAKDAAKYERTKLEFFNFDKSFKICLLNYDLRRIAELKDKIMTTDLKKSVKIAVWIKMRKRIRHFFI